MFERGPRGAAFFKVANGRLSRAAEHLRMTIMFGRKTTRRNRLQAQAFPVSWRAILPGRRSPPSRSPRSAAIPHLGLGCLGPRPLKALWRVESRAPEGGKQEPGGVWGRKGARVRGAGSFGRVLGGTEENRPQPTRAGKDPPAVSDSVRERARQAGRGRCRSRSPSSEPSAGRSSAGAAQAGDCGGRRRRRD